MTIDAKLIRKAAEAIWKEEVERQYAAIGVNPHVEMWNFEHCGDQTNYLNAATVALTVFYEHTGKQKPEARSQE